MIYNFLIAPDFAPERFAGWHMLNTLLQRHSDIGLHLLTPASHVEQDQLIAQQDISLIYANPFDAATLIREQGYRAIARPVGKSDEMVIATATNSDIKALEDIKAGSKVAMANNRDVKLIGLRLLEAVDLTEADLNFQITESYQAAAREVIKGQADVAFFLADIFAGFSKFTHAQLNVLIESDLADISHVLLVKEDFEHIEAVEQVILSLQDLPEAQTLLNELGFERGFEAMDGESAEFMIDLMETLLD